MKRPNITPGPWYTDAGFIHARFSGDDRVHDICDPRCAPPDLFEEMNANETAIAALPDLLEALETARDLIKVARSRFPKSVSHPDTFKLCIADAAIGSALTKAGYSFP